MDRNNLSKPQKKVCRELIDRALQRECEKFIESLPKAITKGKKNGKNPHEIYLDLYKRMMKFDKKLGQTYDNVSGSYYFITVFSLYFRGILTDEDLEIADEEFRDEIKALYASYEKDLS